MAKQIVIKNSFLTAEFSTVGAELISLKNTDGKEYIWQNEENYWAAHCPIVFPICGGLLNDKFKYGGKEYALQKHGFARKMEFEVESVSTTFASFSLTANEATLASYPFNFKFFVNYTLVDNTLVVDYVMKNIDDKALYFSVGGHEGYALSEDFTDYSIKFEHKENLNSYVLEGNYLSHNPINVGENTDSLDLDYKYFAVDALSFIDLKSRKASIYNKKTGKTELTVTYVGFPTLFLWTKPNAKYICIEPWAGMPDRTDGDGILEHKQGIIKIEKGDSKKLTHSISIG